MKPVKPPRINGRVPVLSAQEAVNYIPDEATLCVLGAGGGILGVKLRVGLVAVDQRREPQQVAGVGDLVDAAVVLCCGLVLFAAGAEAIRRIIAVDSS